MFAHSFTHFTPCMALGSDGPKINMYKEPAPDVLLDMLEAAHIQPDFVEWCGRGNILSNWQKPAWFRQAGGPACWLGGGQEGVQGSHCLLVIAGGKQELWPAHANCLLSSAASEVLSPFTQPPWSTHQKSWGKVIREWSRPLNDTDISSPFREESTMLPRAVKYPGHGMSTLMTFEEEQGFMQRPLHCKVSLAKWKHKEGICEKVQGPWSTPRDGRLQSDLLHIIQKL